MHELNSRKNRDLFQGWMIVNLFWISKFKCKPSQIHVQDQHYFISLISFPVNFWQKSHIKPFSRFWHIKPRIAKILKQRVQIFGHSLNHPHLNFVSCVRINFDFPRVYSIFEADVSDDGSPLVAWFLEPTLLGILGDENVGGDILVVPAPLSLMD